MGSPLSLILQINVVICFITSIEAQKTEAGRVFDHVLGRYALESYNQHNKTGFLYEVRLPANLSGLGADIVRYRCGSLKRYGAQVKEFILATGVTVNPCVERVLIIRQNLGEHWSPIYYDSYNISGYELVSHVLGLAAYEASSPNLSEVELLAGKTPIKVDFSNVPKIDTSKSLGVFCAMFDSNGTVRISPQVSPNVCVATRNAHFGLVMESLTENLSDKVSRWKIIVGSTIGGALGVFLLWLLLKALVVKVKKRSQRVEMERRAYEEEALQISMVGHVRAPMAPGTRTLPSLEHDYIPRV